MKKDVYFQIFQVFRQYSIVLVTVIVAFIATFAASTFIEPGVSPFFLLAVMISAWRGGLGAGLLATFLSVTASAFVFLPPRYSFQINRSDFIQLGVFSIAAIIIGSLSAARKRAEEANQKLLEKEQIARQEAEIANRVKDEFLAAVSHELRTPLTTIKTLTRVMQRRELTEIERSEYLADIASECDREIDLVLNLLDLSRIKTSGVQIELKPVNVREVIQACEKIVRGEAEQSNHQILLEISPELPLIMADHSALRRALCAIFENAIKFTAENGMIKIRTKLNNSQVVIEIEDNGRGIAAEDLPHVFEKFYRGNNSNGNEVNIEEVPGIGLGLNLAKTLIVGMKGEVNVLSEIGKGSKFTVSFPVLPKD
ncbi:MAG TPA: ATP-binding protein [Pyrinomonadaceae bacterium]|nr:ATP-binding protein [Pyrinomonadaceae bacterium]